MKKNEFSNEFSNIVHCSTKKANPKIETKFLILTTTNGESQRRAVIFPSQSDSPRLGVGMWIPAQTAVFFLVVQQCRCRRRSTGRRMLNRWWMMMMMEQRWPSASGRAHATARRWGHAAARARAVRMDVMGTWVSASRGTHRGQHACSATTNAMRNVNKIPTVE